MSLYWVSEGVDHEKWLRNGVLDDPANLFGRSPIDDRLQGQQGHLV